MKKAFTIILQSGAAWSQVIQPLRLLNLTMRELRESDQSVYSISASLCKWTLSDDVSRLKLDNDASSSQLLQ